MTSYQSDVPENRHYAVVRDLGLYAGLRVLSVGLGVRGEGRFGLGLDVYIIYYEFYAILNLGV